MDEPGWVSGSSDLPEPTARAGAEPANVVGDLHEAYRDGLQFPARFDQRILRGLRFKVVRRFCKGAAGLFRHDRHHLGRELRMAIEPGADGGATERHFAEGLLRVLDSLNTEFNLPGIPAEFLAQSHRRGILQMGAPDLDDLVELVGFAGERVVQAGEGRNELLLHHLPGSDVNRRGDHIVAGLAQIDVVVRMHQLAASYSA